MGIKVFETTHSFVGVQKDGTFVKNVVKLNIEG